MTHRGKEEHLSFFLFSSCVFQQSRKNCRGLSDGAPSPPRLSFLLLPFQTETFDWSPFLSSPPSLPPSFKFISERARAVAAAAAAATTKEEEEEEGVAFVGTKKGLSTEDREGTKVCTNTSGILG